MRAITTFLPPDDKRPANPAPYAASRSAGPATARRVSACRVPGGPAALRAARALSAAERGFAAFRCALLDLSAFATSLLSPFPSPSRRHRRLVFTSCLPRRFARGPLSFACRPRMRAGGAPGRVTAFPSRLRGATTASRSERDGASRRSTWRFSSAGPALHLPAVPTGIRAATSPPAGRTRPADQAPHLPRPRFAPQPRDATSPPSPRSISGDAPQ